jgi:hypothetical protein
VNKRDGVDQRSSADASARSSYQTKGRGAARRR